MLYVELSESRDVIVAIPTDGYLNAPGAVGIKFLTPLIKVSDPPGAFTMPASWPAAVQLTSLSNVTRGPRLQEWIATEVASRAAPGGDSLKADVPDGLVPRSYQIDGAKLVAATGRALIFDEPRTGKTITTILGLLELDAVKLSPCPVIVVCPASVVDPWVTAFNTWAPKWKAVAWRGTPKKRHALADTADVYVTSYDTARMDAAGDAKRSLLMLQPKALILDECHYTKNSHAERTKAVRRIASGVSVFVALSGTPITHNPADLWPTLNSLHPNAWPSKERWVTRYCDVVQEEYGQKVLGLSSHREPEFRLTLLGQQRRVARADVMSELPPKVYSVRTVELPAEHRRSYDTMARDMLAKLPDGGEISAMSVLSQMTRLSQLASAPADVTVTTEIGKDGEEHEHVTVRLKGPSWKVKALLEILEERPGDPTVAFSVSAQLARIAGEAAEKAGYKVGYIIGGQAMSERTQTIANFQAGQLDLLCATTSAGGVGITLSAAGTLVFLQRPWSLVESLQAEDRAEGDMNAHKGTEIIDVLADKTIESEVRSVLKQRAGQLSELVQDRRIVEQLLGGL